MTMTAQDYQRLGTTEHRLQVLVLDHIRVSAKPGVFAMAFPNAGRRSPRMGQHMKAEGLAPGAPDLVVVLPGGKAAWLELKNGRAGRQSVAQKGMQARLTWMNHPYGLARTLDEAIEFLSRVGALR